MTKYKEKYYTDIIVVTLEIKLSWCIGLTMFKAIIFLLVFSKGKLCIKKKYIARCGGTWL